MPRRRGTAPPPPRRPPAPAGRMRAPRGPAPGTGTGPGRWLRAAWSPRLSVFSRHAGTDAVSGRAKGAPRGRVRGVAPHPTAVRALLCQTEPQYQAQGMGGTLMVAANDRVRVAALGELHCGKAPAEVLAPLLGQVNASADLLVLCGDLTDHGLPEEARALARVLASAVRIPMLAVLGNHDYHSGKEEEVAQILTEVGVTV